MIDPVIAEVTALWLWAFKSNRRLRDFPRRTGAWVLVLTLWGLWHLTGTLGQAVIWLVGIILGVVFVRSWKWLDLHAEQTPDTGIPIPWWRKATNLFTHNKKFAEADERWQLVCQGRLEWGPTGARRSPTLQQKRLTPLGEVKALVRPGDLGGDLQSISALALTVIPGVMKCRVPIIEPMKNDPGSAWITFPDPAKDPLAPTLSILDLPVGSRGRASFGTTEYGTCAEVRKGLSILVTGVTESGKGSVVWDMVFDLERDEEPTWLYVIDPKHMEFAVLKDYVGQWIGNLYIAGYTDTEAGAKAMLREFREEMDERQATAGDERKRKVTAATGDMPARVIIADELSNIKGAFKEGASSDFGLILAQGRATRDWIIANGQLAKISVLGDCRDQFPLRICMRTGTPEQTKAALGVGESEANVYCSRIPVNKQGTGYYVHEDGTSAKFRAHYVDDHHIAHLLETGTLPEGMVTRDLVAEWKNGQRPHYLYRAILHSGRHGYTGETNKVSRRMAEHQRDDVWKYGPCPECGELDCRWWDKHVAYVVYCEVLNHDVGVALEDAEIKALAPPFNIKGNGLPYWKRAKVRANYKAPVFDQVWGTKPEKPKRTRPVPSPKPVPAPKAYTPRPRPKPEPVDDRIEEPALVGANDHLRFIPGFGDSE